MNLKTTESSLLNLDSSEKLDRLEDFTEEKGAFCLKNLSLSKIR